MIEYEVCGYDITIVQNRILKVIKEIDKICRNNNIRYSLCGGSLIGAIRHKGFIPWDDDLDIAMLRDDFDKFVNACKTQLPEPLFLQTTDTEEYYPFDFAKVVDTSTVFMENGFQYANLHNGCYVDIFPLDNVNKKTFILQIKLYSLLRRTRWFILYRKFMPHDIWIKSKKRKETWFTFPIALLGLKRINRMIKALMQIHNGKSTKYVYGICNPIGKKGLDTRAIYEEIQDVEFEDLILMATKLYDENLKQLYGDYMSFPPISDRRPTHNIIKCVIEENRVEKSITD